MTRNKINNIALFYVVLLLGLAIRLVLSLFESDVGVDSVHYILAGDNIARGISFDTWNTTGGRWVMPPIFPLLVALIRLTGLGLEWSGHVASALSGILLLVPLFFLTRRLYGQNCANIAVVLGAFYPILVDYSVVILTENLFAAFVLFMLLSLHKSLSDHGRLIDVILAGIFAGLAFLTKTFGIFLLPFLLLSLLFARGGILRMKPVTRTAIALIAFLLMAVPYWVALKNYTGHWVMDGKGQGQASRIYAPDLMGEHEDPRYSGELTADGSDFLINMNPDGVKPSYVNPVKFAVTSVKKYIQKLVRIYQDFPFTPTYPNNVQLLYLLPAVLLGLGLFTGHGRWSERHSDRFLIYWMCPFVFGIPLVFIEVRYFIPMVPLLIPFMAVGVVELADWILERFSGAKSLFRNPDPGPAIAMVVVIFILLAAPKLTYKVTHWDDPEISYNPRKAAAEWLMSSDYHSGRIMEYAHSVSFYAGAQSILIPLGDLDDTIRIARKYDTDILSLDEFNLMRHHRRPDLEYLFDISQETPPELELIYTDFHNPGLGHVLYRIRTPEEIMEIQATPDW